MLDVLIAKSTIMSIQRRQQFSGTAAFVPIYGSIWHSSFLHLLLNLISCSMGFD